jgi:hypothetical protein
MVGCHFLNADGLDRGEDAGIIDFARVTSSPGHFIVATEFSMPLRGGEHVLYSRSGS